MRPILVWATLLALVSGVVACMPTGRSTWPVETYPNVCEPTWVAIEPSCITFARVRGGFAYGDEFSACRISVNSFVDATNRHLQCVSGDLLTAINQAISDSVDTIECYLRQTEGQRSWDKDQLRRVCPGADVPSFYIDMPGSDLASRLGVPNCVVSTPVASYNFAPGDIFSLERCLDEVEEYSRGFAFLSAQNSYDEYVAHLRRKMSMAANDAVTSFNCVAGGGTLC